MKTTLFIILLIALPVRLSGQGGLKIDLHSGDVMVWVPDSMRAQPPSIAAGIVVVDSIVTTSSASSDKFFTVLRRYLDSNHFGYDTGDWDRAGLNALQTLDEVVYRVAASYKRDVSLPAPNVYVARVMFTVDEIEVKARERAHVEHLKQDVLARIPHGGPVFAQMRYTIPHGSAAPAELTLSPQQAKVVSRFGSKSVSVMRLIDGKRSVHTIALESHMKERKVKEIIQYMMGQGYVRYASVG